jgi:hypothetical protein
LAVGCAKSQNGGSRSFSGNLVVVERLARFDVDAIQAF